MAMSERPVLRDDTDPDQPIAGRTVLVLCGLAWLGVAWAFAFLDRGFGRFPVEAGFWLVVGATGFGLGLLRRRKPEDAKRAAKVLTILAGVLWIFPGFLMFNLVRWAAVGLLLFTAARAAALQTRRDLYFALAAIVAVSLLVVSHDRAQWTIWFYLGPAWLGLALALAWDYAGRVPLNAWTKAGLTSAFLAACIALALAIAAVLPMPQGRGFGMLEPATSHPGRVPSPAGQGGGGEARATQEGDGRGGTSGTQLGGAIQALRDALRDRGLPAWQRQAIAAMLGVAEFAARASGDTDTRVMAQLSPRQLEEMARRMAAVRQVLDALVSLLWLLLAALLLWLARWRIALHAASAGAWACVGLAPAWSLRCSMFALRCTLRAAGHPIRPGESLLEHVQSAPMLPATGRHWLHEAVTAYGAHRFGGAPAAARTARAVRRTVLAVREMLRHVPAAR